MLFYAANKLHFLTTASSASIRRKAPSIFFTEEALVAGLE